MIKLRYFKCSMRNEEFHLKTILQERLNTHKDLHASDR